MASSASVCVSVAISPICMSFLMISAAGDPQVLGDVLDGRAGVDPDDVRWRSRARVERRRLLVHVAPAATSAAAADGAADRDRAASGTATGPAGTAARGLGVDHHAAHAAGAPGARAPRARRAWGAGGWRRAAAAAAALVGAASRCCCSRSRCSCARRADGLTGFEGRAGPSPVPSGRPRPTGLHLRARRAAAAVAGRKRLAGDGGDGRLLVDRGAAALTLMPAFSSRLTISCEGRSNCRASSLTRFFAMCGSSLRCRSDLDAALKARVEGAASDARSRQVVRGAARRPVRAAWRPGPGRPVHPR